MVNTNTEIDPTGTRYCMCGCARWNKPGRHFAQGHDAILNRTLRLVEEGELDGSAIAPETVEDVRQNPELGVGPYTDDDILRLEAIRFSHPEASRRFMRHAKLEFERRDLTQASEKAWGAAAHAVKAAAAVRGLRHYNHRELINAIGQIVRETGQTELRRNFQVAEALHANYYEGWMSTEDVRDSMSDVEHFLAQMEPLHSELAAQTNGD